MISIMSGGWKRAIDEAIPWPQANSAAPANSDGIPMKFR